MTAHLDLDGLCDLLAGEGEPAQLGHVAGCPACSQQLAELEQAQEPVRALLAALPPPEVPADLAARLDAALLRARDEELAQTSRVPAADPSRLGRPHGSAARHGSSARHGGGHRSRRPSWLLGSAAAVAVVAAVAGAGVGLSRLGGDSSTSDSTASGALAIRGVAPTVPASSTGTDYGAGRPALAAALPALLHGRAPAPAVNASGSTGGQTGPDDALARLHSPDGLADCLAGLADPTSPEGPLALDYARYAGAPALVVVLPGAVPERLDVFVVGADCRAGAEDTLLFTELPRTS